MINPGFYDDPAGTLTTGVIALAFGTVVFLFHEPLFFPKKSKSEHVRKWEKRFFKACGGMIVLNGLYLACIGAWILFTHTGVHR